MARCPWDDLHHFPTSPLPTLPPEKKLCYIPTSPLPAFPPEKKLGHIPTSPLPPLPKETKCFVILGPSSHIPLLLSSFALLSAKFLHPPSPPCPQKHNQAIFPHPPPTLAPRKKMTTTARTKQTAKKNGGHKASRVSLVTLQAKEQQAAQAATANAIRTPLQVKKRRLRNSFCLMCRDGGTLWECDVMGCWRVVCNKCLVVPEDSLQQLTQPGVTFRCVSCHWKRTRHGTPQPYYGFYLGDKHVLSKPPAVIGTFQHATTSEMATLSTAIIHLHLDGLTLDPDPESGAAYETAAQQLSSFLAPYARVVVFLTTHSEEQRGDLFAGSRDGQVIASKVSEVLEALLTPLSKVVEGGDLIFLVCGYLVKHQESFQDLKSAMSHFKPRSMLLFDADKLLPVNTIPFLMSVLDLTIIQCFQQMDKTVKVAFKDCGVLGRHSNIILMYWGSSGGRILVERTCLINALSVGSYSNGWLLVLIQLIPISASILIVGRTWRGLHCHPKYIPSLCLKEPKKLPDGKKSSACLVENL
ncbi:hypothetical protein BKA82DRAFT_4018699 [Pisolithus tinctorius]|nr:hypothetical protein BKA82DRAFT_4018699 [Pisolithus tinctorius]